MKQFWLCASIIGAFIFMGGLSVATFLLLYALVLGPRHSPPWLEFSLTSFAVPAMGLAFTFACLRKYRGTGGGA